MILGDNEAPLPADIFFEQVFWNVLKEIAYFDIGIFIFR